ncbi:2fe2s ferredoxin [Plasmopara halstedii]|uniref:2fe2s ferredoxin n=1 Tax=Plasmopara halstedii TaxID=4781 RepID=A0A0N7L424_PLAHL|nr:2fe2s ferredoxin [Plasmopara halstedii]CEG37483.1 2fe2s ferredoxin [Plasmopara halstedii]|eukprot:XP_024573852.1 2fe2s ferredoxin [Plasmopara halstedii]
MFSSTVRRCAASVATLQSFALQHSTSQWHALSFSRRHFSQVSFDFVDGEGKRTTVKANVGETLLDVAQENDLELEGACGGELACSTCHLVFEKRIFDELPTLSEEEEDMLDLAWGLTDTSRLGCQIHVSKMMEEE